MDRATLLVLLVAFSVLPVVPALASPPAPPVAAAVLLADVDVSRLDAALTSRAATNVRHAEVAGFVALETRDPARLATLLDAPVLVAPEAHAESVPDDPEWPAQWGPAAVGMPDAWDIEAGSTAVKIAIVDSGIDADHPDLATVHLEIGTDFVERDADPQDENGHGTHVTGIAAAARGNGVGIAGMARATVLVIRVLDDAASGNCLDVALAILEAVARGAHVVNLSLSCSADYAPLHLAIQAANAAGVLVVASAGNVGASGACPSFPGSYGEVLSVAALDSPTGSAWYSCAGVSVDLAAPGTEVLSTWLGEGYASQSGTSMAAPHVSGLAALVKARWPGETAAGIRARLETTATDLGEAGRDPRFGAGRIDAPAALSATP